MVWSKEETMENSKRINGNYFREILVNARLFHLSCQPIRIEVVQPVFAL